MKKVIDGLVYNTDTAEMIGEYHTPGMGRGDFSFYEAELYKTKNGRYFLYENGGPLTHMAVSIGNNNTAGSEDITPLSEEGAINWLSRKNLISVLEERFPDSLKEA